MKAINEVRAVTGKGLEGDRYFLRTGTYSPKHEPAREVTLIEIEAIDALERDYGVKLGPGDARRNIVTRGVALNHLVGKEFRVGEAVLRGIRLCEPCQHLVRLTGHEKVLPGLVHRGGLRAQIVKDGMIRVGDTVTTLDS
jgi:MOSC domain-containing protein YiiM